MYENNPYLVNNTDVHESLPWYQDFNTIMTIVVFYLLACGIITALVARHNGRSIILGFLSGLFMGQFGVMTYMIMGEKD